MISHLLTFSHNDNLIMISIPLQQIQINTANLIELHRVEDFTHSQNTNLNAFIPLNSISNAYVGTIFIE